MQGVKGEWWSVKEEEEEGMREGEERRRGGEEERRGGGEEERRRGGEEERRRGGEEEERRRRGGEGRSWGMCHLLRYCCYWRTDLATDSAKERAEDGVERKRSLPEKKPHRQHHKGAKDVTFTGDIGTLCACRATSAGATDVAAAGTTAMGAGGDANDSDLQCDEKGPTAPVAQALRKHGSSSKRHHATLLGAVLLKRD
jgi:X-linked retinitis pigmentosa GTPase regulator